MLGLHHKTSLFTRELMLPQQLIVVGSFMPDIGGHYDPYRLAQAHRWIPVSIRHLAPETFAQLGRKPRVLAFEMRSHPFKMKFAGLFCASRFSHELL